MILSILITNLNDSAQLKETIASIRLTAPEPEIVVVDDASTEPFAFSTEGGRPDVFIRNEARCGVGPSRHIGALHATGDWLLIVDSHMRFVPGWYELASQRLSESDHKTMFCSICLGLDKNNMDPLQPRSKYNGATLIVSGRDPNSPGYHVLEASWLKNEPEDGAELPCVMGACYFIRRDWFLELAPLKYLRSWGMDEVMLSLKCWLAGGAVFLMKKVGIGHRFLLPKERQPYNVRQGHPTHNKLFAIYTLMPTHLQQKLVDTLQGTTPAGEFAEGRKLLWDNWHLVAEEQARNRQLFTVKFEEWGGRFNIPLPL